MITSWNIRGLNNVVKLKEIRARIYELKPTIMILIETRVKSNKANSIREKLHLTDNYIENYSNHANGRIWIGWDEDKVIIQGIRSSSQYIYCRVSDVNGTFKFWLIVVYCRVSDVS